MSDTDALSRFEESTVMNFDRWHDGIGYDLKAFDEMTPEQKQSVLTRIRAKTDRDWRDVELLQYEGSRESVQAIHQNVAGKSIETHAAALAALIQAGELSAELIDEKLAPLLDHAAPFDALSRMLDLAESHPGPRVRAALLRNTRRRADVAVHYAAMLYFHAGLAKEAFDWDQRPFYLQFGDHSSRAEREAAFSKLCKDIGVDEKDV